MRSTSLNRRLRGFTLVELVMVIALAGMVVVMISTVLARPLEGFVSQSRRAILVDQAAGALQRMARDVRLAVPNSVRVNPPGAIGFTGPSVEMLNILDAGRYRPNRVGLDYLSFDSTDDPTLCTANFETDVGTGECAAFQVFDPSFPSSSVDLDKAKWMVVYNTGAVSAGAPKEGANVWADADGEKHVIIPAKFTPKLIKGVPDYSDETLIQVTVDPTSSANRFSFESPQHRFYLADQVVGYRCADGKLQRFTRDDLNPAYSGTSNVLAVDVDCTKTSFNYAPGSAQRSGLLNIVLVLTRDGESVQLLQQVHVDNAP